MSPIGGVWLGARPKLTELCLFLLLALILPPARGPGGRERAAGKQPAALQLIISPNLHLLQAVIRTQPLRPTASITQSYSVSSTVIPVSLPPLSDLPRGSFSSSPTYPLSLRACVFVNACGILILRLASGTFQRGRRENEHLSHFTTTATFATVFVCVCFESSVMSSFTSTHLMVSFLFVLQLHICLC